MSIEELEAYSRQEASSQRIFMKREILTRSKNLEEILSRIGIMENYHFSQEAFYYLRADKKQNEKFFPLCQI